LFLCCLVVLFYFNTSHILIHNIYCISTQDILRKSIYLKNNKIRKDYRNFWTSKKYVFDFKTKKFRNFLFLIVTLYPKYFLRSYSQCFFSS
jgi:hypothetical protein